MSRGRANTKAIDRLKDMLVMVSLTDAWKFVKPKNILKNQLYLFNSLERLKSTKCFTYIPVGTTKSKKNMFYSDSTFQGFL